LKSESCIGVSLQNKPKKRWLNLPVKEGFSKAAVMEQYGQLTLRYFDKPQLGPKDALLRVLVAGVCGTDLEIFEGRLTEFPRPLIMGHEIVGEIVETGSEFTDFTPGDLVIVETSISCGKCEYCLTGNQRHCVSSRSFGLRTSCSQPPYLWGGFSEYLYIPEGAELHRIPENVSLEQAVLIISVIANGVQWVNVVGQCKEGDTVVIQGTGPQGMSCCAAAHSAGARQIIMTGLDIDEKRLALAGSFGAHSTIVANRESVPERVKELTGGRMADLVIDVTGSKQVPQISLDIVAKQGTIIHASQMGTKVASELFLDTLVRKEAKFVGVLSKGVEALHMAAELVQTKRYPFEQLISHRFTLDEIEQAFAFSLQKNDSRPIKVVIYPHGMSI
jgi:alcohol dehydrogenase